MMKILNKIWKIINSKFFGYIVLGIFLIFFISMCNKGTNLKEDNARKDQNISAMSDTITESRRSKKSKRRCNNS